VPDEDPATAVPVRSIIAAVILDLGGCIPAGVEHGPNSNDKGIPERNVPDVTLTIIMDVSTPLMITARPLIPSNGDMNFTAVAAQANPDPANVMMICAGKSMLLWIEGCGYKRT
jgi:hypothetical protein